MTRQPESLHDRIATIIQAGHVAQKTSDQVAAEVMALMRELQTVPPPYAIVGMAAVGIAAIGALG